jgi:hypothetical protein
MPRPSKNVVALPCKPDLPRITKPDTSSRMVPVEVEHDLIVRFRAEAAARSTTVSRLLHDLLSIIAADN